MHVLSHLIHAAVQVALVRDDVANISKEVKAAVPPGKRVDTSDLDNAYRQLNTTYNDLERKQKDVSNYLSIVEKVVFILGACAFAVGIWGFITLLARVRLLPRHHSAAACLCMSATSASSMHEPC
jgi:hypothetical protein